MSALFWALFYLVSSDGAAGRATLPSADLSIYLSVDANQPAAPVEYMKRELDALLETAGFRIAWGDANNPDKTGRASKLVVLELRGVCGMPPGIYRMEPSVDSGARLAETSISPAGVQPFSQVNCPNITRMIGPALSAEAGAQRDYLYGRALARVIAHEVYHIVMASRDHEREGIAKSRFTVADLLDETFDFDAVALAKLRQRAVEGLPNQRSGEDRDRATGR